MSHTSGPWEPRFIHRMIKAARTVKGMLIAANPNDDWDDACLIAASPKLLDDLTGLMLRQGRTIDNVQDTLVKRYGITPGSARQALANNGAITWQD